MLAVLATIGISHEASAQTSAKIDDFTNRFPLGTCADAWVTKAVKEVRGKPAFGRGDLAECNVRLYGGGKWTGYDDLVKKVRERVAYDASHPRECRDPFVTKAIREVTGYAPADNAENGDCNMYNWVEGAWPSYEAVRAEVAQVHARWVGIGMLVGADGRRTPSNLPAVLSVQQSTGNLTVGNRVFTPSQWSLVAGPSASQIVASNTSRIIGENSSGIVAPNSSRIISDNSEGLISPNGASFVSASNGALVTGGKGALYSAKGGGLVTSGAASLKAGQTMYVSFNASTVIALKAP